MTSAAPPRSPAPILLLLLACVAACVAISSQGFWVDEAETGLHAMQSTLPGWWHSLLSEHNTNIQLPLYMLYIWGWARVFGFSEIALRAANIPWFFLGVFAILHFLRRHIGLRDATLLLYCLHPFVWYYQDEARPYLMQIASSLLVAGALFEALDQPDEPLSPAWWWLFGAGVTILCGTGILGIPWAVAITLLLSRRPGFFQSMSRSGRPALLLFIPLLGAIALFFAWTIQQKIATAALDMNFRSIAGVFYEQLGFLGLGPGRIALRTASLSVVRAYLVPIALLALPLGWALVFAARRRFGLSQARLTSILLLIAGPVCLIFALGYLRHTRILARHLTPLFPFLLLAQAYAVLSLWKSGRPGNRGASLLIVAALAFSSLELRFAFRHSKDDDRAASAAAAQLLAQGKTVWWGAGVEGAMYYHLPVAFDQRPGAVMFVDGLPSQFTAPPDAIIFSRPDVCDVTGTLGRFIATHNYRVAATWQSFTLWEK